jgi:hypothetical protein
MTDLEVIDRLARWMNGIEDEVSIIVVNTSSTLRYPYTKNIQGSSSDKETHEPEGDDSSVTSFESEESENHEEHPSGFIPLSMGLDHVCLFCPFS